MIEGIVVDAEGSPVPDVAVDARAQPPTADPERVASALQARALTSQTRHLTDRDGRFRIEGLAKGIYALRAAPFGGPPRIVTGVSADHRWLPTGSS